MNQRKSIIVLSMLCAFALSAFAASSASAATEGLTLFTCKEVTPKAGTAGFSKAHCKKEDAVSTEAKYEHVEIPAGTTTNITGTSENTKGEPEPSQLHSVIAGIEVELQSKLAHIHPEVGGVPQSWVTNAKDATTNEHYFHGEANVDYTEVEVLKPAGKGCKVKGGTITTNKLKFSSKGLKEDTVIFEPASGTTFASFEVEACAGSKALEALNGVYEVQGSVEGTIDGSTITFTRATTTAQGKLTLRGQKAGYSGSATVKGTDSKAGEKTDTALSATTIPTP